MNEEKLNKINGLLKGLNEEDYGMLELEIVYEMNCQLTETIKTEDYIKLYNEIEYAYLKLEGVALENVVRCALEHIRRILDDDETFDLREEACWY